MSEQLNNSEVALSQEDEMILADLKNKADLMGIKYHPSIGIETLSNKIKQILEAEKTAEDSPVAENNVIANGRELIRIQVTCMDPSKKNYEAEIFTAGNSKIGMHSKCVPFGKPFHVPKIIYNMMKEKQFQMISDSEGGGKPQVKLVNTYAIEVLPPLNEKELFEIKQRQAMVASGNR